MIAYLKGTILRRLDRSIILKAGEVGYSVNVSESFLETTKENEEIELFAHTHVRKDALEIFGFKTFDELNFFKKLISISGVGPRTASDILSLPIDKLKNAILNEEPAFICTAPKVGKRIADRIVLELKNKITMDDADRTHKVIKNDQTAEDVYAALEKLGYTKKQIDQTLNSLPKDTETPEQIIKFFLQNA